MKIKFFLLVLSIAAMWQSVQAQPVPQDSTDLVWSLKTDQSAGFWMVKFSNTDSLIVGHGYDYDLFFDAKTGQEIQRIHNDNEVFFINNDNNFIVLNQSRTRFDIYDALNYTIIDSIENDGVIINEYPIIDMSKDGKYLIAPIPRGFRIWDLTTKRILKTKLFPDEPNLISVGVDNPRFTCDNNKIVTQFSKKYFNPNNPNQPITVGSFTVYDFNTLDSIDSFGNHRGFVLSKTCKYIAYGTGDPDFGVEVYDFNTKEFLWKIPINGPSLTGIEFSPDDKYLVTSSGPDANAIYIWDINTEKKVYSYLGSSFLNIDVSHNGKYIIESVGRWIELLKFNDGNTSVPGDSEITPQIIYPNPSTGVATIQYQQHFSEITNIYITGINGQIINSILSNFLEEGNKIITFNTQDIPDGTYFIKVENVHLSLIFKLIVNK
ncbi:MAG: hypothetical protein A2X61_15945 [Ignavibacteria bacterium GWB2_35_12]|nr:MAG: hypothetical protein A2X63_07250 [Ignavibacteria bacterium GWA2_35_8]OGU40864.1 MAG: hypothetical protein A2X61_15945 [Ignavibacteria bacterium GWB2_35_12]OGU92716.1 MAG: hypothetical protein A2220_11150 [Ignavibacteria bacterium RIFOXYA2_FULL_35_10]OGV24691.1 MAG: hypothetical protein A2475_14720 [Ignavibacteria bacterium RIFOXYC2_FULL_35_21]